jgi:hypothetical protein
VSTGAGERVVAVDLGERPVELGDQLGVERVERLGPVQRDQGDGAPGARRGWSRKAFTRPLAGAAGAGRLMDRARARAVLRRGESGPG